MNRLMLFAASLSLLVIMPAHGRTRTPAGAGIAGRGAAETKAGASSAPDIYFEDFEGIPGLSVADIGGVLPALGWGVSGTSASPFEAYFIKGLYGHSGTYYLYSAYDETAARDEWAITPAVALDGGRNYRVALFANMPGYKSVIDEFRIMAGTEPTPAGMLTTVIDATGEKSFFTEEQEWKEAVGRFTPPASGNYYFGVNHCSRKDGNFVAFDDFRISLIPETGGEVEFLCKPYFEYTMIPSGWSLPASMQVEYRVRNVGDNPLERTALSVDVAAGAEEFTVTKPVGTLQWDAAEDGSARFDGIGTPDLSGNVECSLRLRDASGSELVSLTDSEIASPDRTTPWLARDNGEISGYMSLSLFNDFKTAGRIGTRFTVVDNTDVDAVKFVLLGGYSTAKTVIARLYKINSKGTVVEYAMSRREQLSTGTSGYTEYTLTFPSAIDLTPGEYIVSLDENNGEALGLALTSNYTGYGLAFSLDGNEWNVLPATPSLRLRTVGGTPVREVGADTQSPLTVRADGSAIIVEGAPAGAGRLRVYTPSGAMVLDARLDGGSDCRVPHALASGVYIVAAAGRTAKILIP